MRKIIIYVILFALLAACNPTPAPTLPVATTPAAGLETQPATAEPVPSVAATPTATPTSLPARAVLLAPPGSDLALAQALYDGLAPLMAQSGLIWERAENLSPAGAELRLVLVLSPDPGLATLAAAAPQTQFVAIGIGGLQPGANLSLLGAEGVGPDRQAFIAGAGAALVTDDWRVAVLSPSDTPAGAAARDAFLNGVVYICGLCNPAHGPIVDYPLAASMPAGASAAEWQAAAQALMDQAVTTIYLAPGAGGPELRSFLAAAGLTLLGGERPDPAWQANWAASIMSDPLPALQALLPELLQGQGGQSAPLPLGLQNVNEELFSPGRQQQLQIVMDELAAGYIDSGVLWP